MLAACNGGDPSEDTLEPLEVGAARVCAEANGCQRSADATCLCGTTRYTASGAATSSLRCERAMETARDQALAKATAACPAGYCNAVEQEGLCERAPSGAYHATFYLTYSCKDPATCL
ncbi:hypothetical protein LY474_19365 [Myxococcus stipitatus]|uniref:hypothetical protein n=1 Tax=Myxococcus stipitatus TaxID=83455 RepID=UPI001F3E98B8|nr:hypothetical protein [Myxococcus stipitatus]MCE9669962.1 hypothetical protein [Myxococcus stipitatus]